MSKLGFERVDFPVLSERSSLERHGSLPLDEEQRVTKKVKNKEDGISMISEVLVAAGDDGSEMVDAQVSVTQELDLNGRPTRALGMGSGVVNHSDQMDGVEFTPRVEADESRSYAAAVIGARDARAYVKTVPNPDDIVVLDEDVIVDENGTRSYYGRALWAWMVVGDRKRRPRRMTDIGKPVELVSRRSRFDALADEAGEELVVHAAVVQGESSGAQQGRSSSSSPMAGASSSNGKKATKKGTLKNMQTVQDRNVNHVAVEPMIPGQVPVVVGNGGGAKDSHKGVIIVEDGMGAGGGRRSSVRKGFQSAAKLKVQVRKQSEFKAPNLPLLSDWIHPLASGGDGAQHAPAIVNSTSALGDPPDSNLAAHTSLRIGGEGHSDVTGAHVMDMAGRMPSLDE
ncbi:hypothetical protein V6N13_072898 [Hibiscus sabdariffa]|uniref:Uncharacterized protein n=1 Tax=Hibiscus sabdariffa TaxID=183260 RepID=A0ABR2E7I1_9ROSI